MSIAATGKSGTSILVVAALVVVAILVPQGRSQSRSSNLNRGERMRPLAISSIDPIISLLIIGPLLWRIVSLNGDNVLSAVVGAAVGVVVGYFRARVMFVRAEKGSKTVVLKRSAVEYALVFVLIVLRLLESRLQLHHFSVATLGVAALAALGLFEAFARAGFIIARYVAPHELPASTGTPDGSPPFDDGSTSEGSDPAG